MKKILILIISIIAVFILIFAYIMLNKSSQGLSQAEKESALSKLLGRKLNSGDKSVGNVYIQYNGKYVSFVYPKDANPFDEQNKPGGAYFAKSSLETFVFSLSNPFIWASVQVLPNTSGTNNLEDYSGIRVRQLDLSTYKQSSIEINGYKGLLFDKAEITSGTEKTAFFLVNNRIYTVYVSSTNKNNLKTIFDRILSSLKFL